MLARIIDTVTDVAATVERRATEAVPQSWRSRIGQHLRCRADRIDYRGTPGAIGWSFTFENREGIRFRDDGKGCRLWHLGDDDYQRAHTEADTEHFQIDWAGMRCRTVGGAADGEFQ